MSDDVYTWLSKLTTTKPLMDHWRLPNSNYSDPVRELYANDSKQNSPDLWVWIVGSMSFTLICIMAVLFVGWKKTGKKSPKEKIYTKDYASPYEAPVDIQLEEVHVYEKGRRVSSAVRSSLKPNGCENESLAFDKTRSQSLCGDRMQHSVDLTMESNGLVLEETENDKPKKKLKRFLHCSHFNTSSRSKQQEKMVKVIRPFHGRPLPPPPTLSDLLEDKHKNPFYRSHMSFESHMKSFEDVKTNMNFDQNSNQLLKKSQEQVTVKAFQTHNHAKPKLTENENCSPLPLQSKFFDDQYISYNNKTSCKRKLIRNSKSLDILEESLTADKLNSEINYSSAPSICESQGYIKLPCDSLPSINASKEQEHMTDNKPQSKSKGIKKDENTYAHIPDLFITRESLNLQQRPIPLPPELQHPQLKITLSKDHIYQRASIIQTERNNKRGSSLTEQFASFRSISSYGSNQYAKIPEIIDNKTCMQVVKVDVRPGYKFK